MSYATPEDYKEYGEGLITGEQLDKALSRASDEIDALTYNRIVGRGFDNLTEFQQTNITKSVCLQADFVHQYGDYLNMPIESFSAGSISMSLKVVEGGGGVRTTESIINLLGATGLTSRRL